MFVLSVRYGFEMQIILVHMLKYALSRCDTHTYGDIWESALSHYLKYGIYLDKSVSDLLFFTVTKRLCTVATKFHRLRVITLCCFFLKKTVCFLRKP